MKGILFLLIFSTLIQARCFVHVFLGAADAGRHFHRGEWVEDRAKEMGCLVFKTHDLSVNDTDQKLKDFMTKHKFDADKDRLHISYVDHGSSSSLPYGGGYASYNTVLSNIDKAVPKGTDITFSSHICWPGFNDQIANHKFTNIKSMCGGTSVDSDNLSNAWGSSTEWARNREYLPSGWDYWANEYDEKEGNDFWQMLGIESHDHAAGHTNTNMFNFHYQSLDNDVTNMLDGSSLTSLTFARNKLNSIGKNTYKNPYDYLFEEMENNSVALYDDSYRRVGASNIDEVCVHCTMKKMKSVGLDNVFRLQTFADQLESGAIQNEIDQLSKKNSLYQAYAKLYRQARKWINENRSSINNKASHYATQKEILMKKIVKAESEKDYDKAASLQEDYSDLMDNMKEDFKMLFVKFRMLNDVEMIVKLKEESPESMEKFERFMACERRNALDII